LRMRPPQSGIAEQAVGASRVRVDSRSVRANDRFELATVDNPRLSLRDASQPWPYGSDRQFQ
jgi:hypothetical protein